MDQGICYALGNGVDGRCEQRFGNGQGEFAEILFSLSCPQINGQMPCACLAKKFPVATLLREALQELIGMGNANLRDVTRSSVTLELCVLTLSAFHSTDFLIITSDMVQVYAHYSAKVCHYFAPDIVAKGTVGELFQTVATDQLCSKAAIKERHVELRLSFLREHAVRHELSSFIFAVLTCSSSPNLNATASILAPPTQMAKESCLKARQAVAATRGLEF